jgi:hypothetical protein
VGPGSANVANIRSYRLGAEYGRQAIELARQHGWTDQSIAGIAYTALAAAALAQGRLEEAEAWSTQSARFRSRSNRRLGCSSTTFAGGWSSRAADIRRHWPRSGAQSD